MKILHILKLLPMPATLQQAPQLAHLMLQTQKMEALVSPASQVPEEEFRPFRFPPRDEACAAHNDL